MITGFVSAVCAIVAALMTESVHGRRHTGGVKQLQQDAAAKKKGSPNGQKSS